MRPTGARAADRPPVAMPRRIALVGMSAIGDVVWMLPVVNALKRAYPRAHLSWIIQPLPHRVVRGHAAVDEFILFHRRRGLAGARAFLDIRRALRGRRFDLLVDLQVAFKAGVITALADAEVKLGYDRRRARDANWLFTTHRIPPRPRGHVLDEYFEFLEYLGVDPEPIEWRIPIDAGERSAQRAFFDRLERPVCAVVVGTSRRQKNWLPERYARVIDALESDHGVRTVLVGGPSVEERRIADAIQRHASAQPIDMLGDDVRRLVWLLDGSDLVVSPDTGPLHIARALDVPVVGLFGYTDPRRYGPYRKYGDLVVDGYTRAGEVPAGPSGRYRPDGMGRIGVQAVLDAVDRALERYVRPGAGHAPDRAAGARPVR